MHAASGSGLWIGRPCERPGSRPQTLEPELGTDYGGLSEWARDNVVKVLCFCHPDDNAAIRADHEATVKRLFEASRRNNLEFLLEIIPSKVAPVNDETSAILIQQFYDIGVFPDWWKLEPMTTPAAWSKTIAAIEKNDRHTRGIVVLGLDAPEGNLPPASRWRRVSSSSGVCRRANDFRRCGARLDEERNRRCSGCR